MALNQMSAIYVSLDAVSMHMCQKVKGKSCSQKARKCIPLGYSEHQKGYRLYNPSRAKVFHSRDIIFNEVSVPRIEKEQKSDGGKCVELETESVTDDFPLPTLKILIQKLLEWRLILKVITQQKSLREEADTSGPLVQ
jgi:hypothetical protein